MHANDLELSGQQRWVVVASRQHLNAAQRLAEDFKHNLQGSAFEQQVYVVRSQNDWFGIVIGPVTFKSMRLTRAHIPTALPKDAYLSRGQRYVETVWPEEASRFGEFGAQPCFRLELEGLRVHADLIPEKSKVTGAFSESSQVRVDGWAGAKKVFSFTTEPDYYPEYGQSAKLIRLSTQTPFPQVAIKRFTGGAHCCVEQTIITQDRRGRWMMISGPVLDGASGYRFERSGWRWRG